MRVATRDPIIIESAGAFHEVYPRLLEAILGSGRPVAPRGQETYEVSPMVFTLENPRDSIRLQKARRINYAYAIIEKLSLLYGVADPETFCFYIPALRKLLNEDGVFGGAYGPRVTEQLDFVYSLLVEDPQTRRAVITVYSAREDHYHGPDIPCTVSLQFLLRDRRLSLLANMRSSDVYLGLPYDVQQFTFLQQLMAYWLGVDVGSYTHVAGSGHVYERDIHAAEGVIARPDELNARHEPALDLDYEIARVQATSFFEIERHLRRGGISSPHEAASYDDLSEYLRFCLGRVTAFIRRKAGSAVKSGAGAAV